MVQHGIKIEIIAGDKTRQDKEKLPLTHEHPWNMNANQITVMLESFRRPRHNFILLNELDCFESDIRRKKEG